VIQRLSAEALFAVGIVAVRRHGNVDLFRTDVDPRRIRRAFDGSAKNLVLGALSSQKVSAAELAEIRQILDKFEKGSL
jgi:predicted transcriptional regulator